MAEETKVVPIGKLDKEGLKSIGKSFLITIGGAVIGFIADLAGVVDFGSFQSIAAVALPFIANLLYKWLAPYQKKA